VRKSVKAQIMDQIEKDLQALCSQAAPCPDNRTRGVSRSLDPLAASERLPWIFLYDGEERQTEEDNFGRTYEFPIGLKCLIEGQDLAARKDYLVPEVQRIVESNRTLTNSAGIVLAVNLEDGSEQPFIDEVGKPLGGALLFYTITYRRKLGDPYTNY
jgi:hypothetical protein